MSKPWSKDDKIFVEMSVIAVVLFAIITFVFVTLPYPFNAIAMLALCGPLAVVLMAMYYKVRKMK